MRNKLIGKKKYIALLEFLRSTEIKKKDIRALISLKLLKILRTKSKSSQYGEKRIICSNPFGKNLRCL